MELSASGYMAITTNTIQFGAEFTAAIKAGNWKIEGKIGGDALIRMPFRSTSRSRAACTSSTVATT